MDEFEPFQSGTALWHPLAAASDRGDPVRMIETFIFLSALAAAPQVPLPSGHDQSSSVTVIETHPAPCDVLEGTFNAFVAVEESPDLRQIVRPAIVVRAGEQQTLVDLSATAWIS